MLRKGGGFAKASDHLVLRYLLGRVKCITNENTKGFNYRTHILFCGLMLGQQTAVHLKNNKLPNFGLFFEC